LPFGAPPIFKSYLKILDVWLSTKIIQHHTFAVRAFKQMIDAGIDMYASLPILSTYLGHKSIYDTEKYLRLTMLIYPYIEEKCHDHMEAIFGLEENGDGE